ncbi:MAG: OmpA family protein [Pseudomonadota bacterium]
MFKSTVAATALIAASFLGAASAEERTIITEAPTAEEYVDMLFATAPPVEIKTRGLPAQRVKTRGIATRGIQMTGANAASTASQARKVVTTQAQNTAQRQPLAQPAPKPIAQAPSPAQAPVAAKLTAQPPVPATPASASAPSTAAVSDATPSKTTVAPTPKIVAAPVNFSHDSADIPAYFEPYLINLAAAMQRPEAEGKLLIVSGHTDSRGSANYNLDLSMRRARAIEVFLLARGVDAAQLVSTGKGERELIAGREDEHAINRRVEFKVAG